MSLERSPLDEAIKSIKPLKKVEMSKMLTVNPLF